MNAYIMKADSCFHFGSVVVNQMPPSWLMNIVFLASLFVCVLAVLIRLRPGQVQRIPGSQQGTWLYNFGEGFCYHRSDVKRNAVYFKCAQYERGCKARATYYRGGLLRGSGQHIHRQDPFIMLEKKMITRVLNRCRNLEYVSFRRIIDEEGRLGNDGGRFPRPVLQRVTLKRMRSSMQKVRKSVFPDIPQSLTQLTEFLQNPQYRVMSITCDGEDNIYGASVTDENGDHHVILTSRRLMHFARRLRILFSDGTFKTTPAIPGVVQIFTVVGNWRFSIIPLMWVLMESQTEVAYTSVLRVLRLMLQGAPNLERVISDFERAIRNAWHNVFPARVVLQGCFFHYVRALVMHGKNTLGLGRHLQQGHTRTIVRLTCALPLLPPNLIVDAFHLILREALDHGVHVYGILRPFFAYMVRYWINNRVRRNWMCVFGSVHRTNNTCESNNNRLGAMLDRRHVNIFNFLDVIAKLEDKAVTDIAVLTAGRKPSRRRKAASILNDLRLRGFYEDLENPPGNMDDAILLFLHRASHTFENVYNDAVE